MLDAISAAVATLATLLAILFGGAPSSARCPHGWWLSTGVRRDGRYACTRVPIGDDHRDARGIEVDDSIVPPGEVRGRIYCTNGQEPIVVDERTVGCQQHH